MEIVPALGSVFLLIRRNLRHKLHKKELEVYPEITLIIPVYNSADTLYGCIRSINDSTYPNDMIRIFLVNNKGKDNSFDIYAQCQQEFPELLMQWMNSEQGKSRALNLALYNILDTSRLPLCHLCLCVYSLLTFSIGSTKNRASSHTSTRSF